MYRALIVEDEDLMREYLAAKLSDLCPEWEAGATAADGMEAVERMAHERFDAVLTDIRMPGMDGLELARYIRRTDAQMPILILSGYDEFNYARAAMRLNVFDYLLKPLNEEELAAALTSMAALAALRKAAPAAQSTALALGGEPAALAMLQQMSGEKSIGVLMIAPSLLLPPSVRAEAFHPLAENITGGLWNAEQVSPGIVAVFCSASDPLLVATEGRALFSRVCERHTAYPLHAGFAPFDPTRALATSAEAEAALRIALSTNVAWVSQPLLYAQRQHLSMLDAFRANLSAAMAQKTLSDQHRGALLAALRDVPLASAVASAACLLWESDADSHAPCKRPAYPAGNIGRVGQRNRFLSSGPQSSPARQWENRIATTTGFLADNKPNRVARKKSSSVFPWHWIAFSSRKAIQHNPRPRWWNGRGIICGCIFRSPSAFRPWRTHWASHRPT